MELLQVLVLLLELLHLGLVLLLGGLQLLGEESDPCFLLLVLALELLHHLVDLLLECVLYRLVLLLQL